MSLHQEDEDDPCVIRGSYLLRDMTDPLSRKYIMIGSQGPVSRLRSECGGGELALQATSQT